MLYEFYFLISCLYASTPFYVVIARLYIFLAIFFCVPSLDTISLFCLLISIYFTLLLHCLKLLYYSSNFVLASVQEYAPFLLEKFFTRYPDIQVLVLMSETDPLPPSPKDIKNNRSTYSLFSYNHIVNRYNFIPLKLTYAQKFGLGVGVCTLLVGCVAAGYSYLSYQSTLEQTKHLERQTDVKQVKAGLKSLEDFHKKWPPK